MKYFKLNNDKQIPAIGTGTNTFGKPNHDFAAEINGDFSPAISAIETGYRLFDTAIMYRNEAGIGKTLAESSVPREEFYITTKIPAREGFIDSRETVRHHVFESLKNLQTNYIDLYLIHHPWEDEPAMLRTWEALEELVAEGKLRSIGVSNFNVEQLEFIMKNSKTTPAVNQVQSNPNEQNHEVIKFCKRNGIAPQAWGPVSRIPANALDLFTQIGTPYAKSWAQIILRYNYQRGVLSIPKSHSVTRQIDNINIFDFELTATDVQAIDALYANLR